MYYNDHRVEYLFLQYIKEHENFVDADIIRHNVHILYSCGGFNHTQKYASIEELLDCHPNHDKADKNLCEMLRVFFHFHEKSTTLSRPDEISDYLASEFPKYLAHLEKLIIVQPKGNIQLYDKAERHIVAFEQMQEIHRKIVSQDD